MHSNCPKIHQQDILTAPCGEEKVKKLLENPSKSLLLYGMPRTGKSTLAWYICGIRWKEYKEVKVYESWRLSSEISSAYKNGVEQEFFKSFNETDVLFVDDLGRGRFTDRVGEGLFWLIERFMKKEKQLIFTTNLDSSGLIERFSDKVTGKAVLARLKEYCLVMNINRKTK